MTNYSLKNFRERLDQWREETPEHRKQVVPEFMMKELLELIPMSSRSYVAKRLKIDPVLLAQKINSYHRKGPDIEFVDISPSPSEEVSPANELSAGVIEYISSSGSRINFRLPDLNAQAVSAILKDRAS